MAIAGSDGHTVNIPWLVIRRWRDEEHTDTRIIGFASLRRGLLPRKIRVAQGPWRDEMLGFGLANVSQESSEKIF